MGHSEIETLIVTSLRFEIEANSIEKSSTDQNENVISRVFRDVYNYVSSIKKLFHFNKISFRT